MPRKRKSTEGENGTNQAWTDADLEKIVDEIEAEQNLISEYQSKAAEQIATVRGHISGVYKRAGKLGIKRVALKAIIEDRRLSRKKKENMEKLDTDDQGLFIAFQKALGDYIDTPLGRAAAENAEHTKSQRKSAIADIGVKGLAAGIKPLN